MKITQKISRKNRVVSSVGSSVESSVGSSEEARRAGIEWRLSGVLSYEAACNEMQERAMALVKQQRDEAGGGGGSPLVSQQLVSQQLVSQLVWLLEHPAMI